MREAKRPLKVMTARLGESHERSEAYRWPWLQQDLTGQVKATVGPHGLLLRHQLHGGALDQRCPALMLRTGWSETLVSAGHPRRGRALARAWRPELSPSRQALEPRAQHTPTYLLLLIAGTLKKQVERVFH